MSKEPKNNQVEIEHEETVTEETTTNTNDTAATNEEETEDEAEKLKYQLADSQNKYLRLLADFDNYRKRMNRERLELIQSASKEVITSLLPVLDDFERAFKAQENNTDSDTSGFELIYHKIATILEHKGLKPMQSIGEEFDAEYHDAITEIPAPTADLKGKVIDEVEKGYYLNDTIIRYARVVVGK
jgi:molecular chaperone GrpE